MPIWAEIVFYEAIYMAVITLTPALLFFLLSRKSDKKENKNVTVFVLRYYRSLILRWHSNTKQLCITNVVLFKYTAITKFFRPLVF